MRLEEGMKITAIFFPDDSAIRVGTLHCQSITVAMQLGQYSLVPWVMETRDGGTVKLWNCEHLAGVELEVEE